MITIEQSSLRRAVMVKQDNLNEVWENVVKMLETMKYGSITLVVQDGKVVQLEKNEKVRIR
jgi:hypothetical protein